MKKIAVVALFSLVIALPATASDMYVGLKLGSAKHDVSTSGYTETVSAAGLFAGYKINPNFAVEAEITNLGSLLNSTVKISAVSLGVVGSLNLNDDASLYAKLAAASTHEEIQASGLYANKSGATVGFGGQYNVNKTLGLRLGWDRYTYGGEKGFYEATASMTSVSALINF